MSLIQPSSQARVICVTCVTAAKSPSANHRVAPGYEPFDNPRYVTNKDLRDNKDREISRSLNFIGQPNAKQVGS